ncbi:MAG TPA: prenyltransferase, partial [Anaerolineales bacterium]|nr:prenyltransferase [Anaerolineales bacterium]
MNHTVAMWRKSLSQLIRMDDKREWDSLDILSKWFIATRSAVGTVTLYSGLIGGLLAWQYLYAQGRHFDVLTWLVLTLGLFIAHGTNNLLNDYTDFSRGIDKDNYFRTQYGVHPLAQGFWDKRTHLIWFGVSGLLATLSGIYALLYTHFDPIVVWLFAFGALILLFYTYPLKYVGIGELSIFLIWGPLMIGGVFYVLTGAWDWMVILASIPVGLNVVTINLGKHTDKAKEDVVKGVRTLPVLIGETAARYVTIGAIVLSYLITFYLILVPHFFTPVLLLVLVAYKP